MLKENIVNHNRLAWNKFVDSNVEYTIPVSKDVIDMAKKNIWDIRLTPLRNVPKEWLGDIKNKKILCLACGGGQQGPILSAAGAIVTVYDISENQLEQDKKVATENNLSFNIVQGDMTDLSIFNNDSFDIIFHPVSNTFVKDIIPVWQECFRVLKPEGILLSGFTNPLIYIFDSNKIKQGIFEVKYSLPYCEDQILDEKELQLLKSQQNPLEYSHTFEKQIGGQINSGFCISGFYEDYEKSGIIKNYFPSYFATKAIRNNFICS